MRTIAVFNRKGGTGKTVTAINMAAELAAQYRDPPKPPSLMPAADRYRVLVIDADSQYDATRFFGFDPEKCVGMAELILGRKDYAADDYVYETIVPGVSLVPGSSELDAADVRGAGNLLCVAELIDALREDAEAADEAPPYDFVLIDCPPNYSEACKAALYAADDVIIPVAMGKFAIDGMADVMVQINNMRTIQPRIRVAGALVTMWHNTPAAVQAEAALRASSLPVFDTHIRRTDRVDEALFKSQTLDTFSRRSAAAQDYRAFVVEYLEGVRGDGKI